MTSNKMNPPSGPLVGIRVLDFCSFIAGTYSASLLGEMGADVIKIEPLEGDPARQWGPFIGGEGKFFLGWNRNKRGLAVDLQSESGKEIVHRLAAEADVVIENFRPGVTEKLRIDYPTLRALNPRLIYCSSTAFGSEGPYRSRPAYDPVLQSMSGAAMATVRFSGVIGICSVPVVDYQTAMLVVTGVLAALYHRERTGEGQRVETSLLQGAMACQTHCYCEPLETKEAGPTGIYPYRLFNTSDSMIFIAAPTNKFWRMLCSAIGADALGSDPKYKTNTDRVNCADELNAKLQEHFSKRTTRDWEALLVEAGVPCGPVLAFADFLHDAQVEATGMNPVIDHSSIGPVRVSGVPLKFEKTRAAIQRAAPLLGEHTVEILDGLGYDSGAIERFRSDKVI